MNPDEYVSEQNLYEVLEWAQHKLRGQSEPPWTWYRYMQLVEATTALLRGREATRIHVVRDDEPIEVDLPS